MKYSSKANLMYFFNSLLCQVVALGVTKLLLSISPSLGLIFLVLAHCLTAFLLASWLKLPAVWKVFNLLIIPAALLYESAGLPAFLLAAAFVLSVLVYLPTFWTRIPYYPTSYKTYEIISEQLPSGERQKFIDLGCGFSELLIYLAKRHPQMDFYGTEISPLPFIVSKIKSLFYRNIKISFENFWSMNFAQYEIVYAFLAPPPMERLWDKVQTEMNPGTLFMSNTFEVPASPDKIIEINDKRNAKIMVFLIKPKP